MSTAVRLRTVCCLLLFVAPALPAQTIGFTKDQVDAGQALYKEGCQLCHGSTLANGQFATPLKGAPFQDKWHGMTVGDLLTFVYEKMPPDKLKSLTPEQVAGAAAFILSKNGIAPSDTVLGPQQAATPLPW